MSSLLHSRLSLAPAAVQVERRHDGSLLLRSPEPLAPPVRCVGDWLVQWAAQAPDRTFLAERESADADAPWRRLGYAEALRDVRRIAQGLLDRGLGPSRPVMVISENSIDHALLNFAALHVGVPVVPVSVAYSLLSRDHAKLRQIAAQVKPGLVFAQDPQRYAAALDALGMESASIEALSQREPGAEVDAAHAAVGPDTVAKFLFTSGSTGVPKGVINTQRMLTANQQQSRQVWRFLAEAPPVVLDWLPWSHTFGGNYNLHMVLSSGGTMYLDGGKPTTPEAFAASLRNLREIAPTMYFNVPRGFDMLVPALEADAALRRRFFERCDFIFYAAAALPANLWARLEALAQQERGGDLALVSSWGSTETAPLAVAVHYAGETTGVVGLPVPGCELKLVPAAGKLEARLRGPHITPGYLGAPEATAAAFDDEGFYRTGDALRFVDEAKPERGLVFDGRVAEDFKLVTGTWVHVGALRVRLIAAADPLLQDAVITGHDRGEIGALLFLSAQGAALPEAERRERLSAALRRVAEEGHHSSSLRIARALVQSVPPRADLGEITDKGYLNQRAVREQREADVLRLHADALDPHCITP